MLKHSIKNIKNRNANQYEVDEPERKQSPNPTGVWRFAA